jgi:hypothetical protein
MTECYCPFCPLIAANLNVCDVMVMDMGKENRIYGPDGRIPFEIGEHINDIILYCKKNQKQKVGESLDLSRPGYTCNVARLKRGLFKFCFHTVPEENPLAMD